MERLSIDEIIEHCEKKTIIYEKSVGVEFLETTSLTDSIKEYWEHKQVKDYLKELKKYISLKEQGLLLRLPCKAGDTVWDNDYGMPCAYTITGFSFGTGEDYIDEPVSEKEIVYYYSNSSGSITGSFASSEFGKTVFLTKEEAEQKLKEMESD